MDFLCKKLEDFLKSISETDLYRGPIFDRDKFNEEVFVFLKSFRDTIFYVKIKKDNDVKYDRIKILSCHEALYGRDINEKY